jgi:hypothetical protein
VNPIPSTREAPRIFNVRLRDSDNEWVLDAKVRFPDGRIATVHWSRGDVIIDGKQVAFDTQIFSEICTRVWLLFESRKGGGR